MLYQLLLSFGIWFAADNYVQEIPITARAAVVNSCVKVIEYNYDDYYSGTGTVIAHENGHYLIATCHHVIEGDDHVILIKIPTKKIAVARIIAISKEEDLALLEIDDNNIVLSPCKFSKLPARPRFRYLQVGYPLGIGPNIKQGFFADHGTATFAKFNNYQKIIDAFSFRAIGGDSGSSVFNRDGEIVSMIWASAGKSQSALGTPLKYIKDFCRSNCKKNYPVFVTSLDD